MFDLLLECKEREHEDEEVARRSPLVGVSVAASQILLLVGR